ncbi:MAG: hypothetical protein ACO1NX_09105 [Chitinophagaceae bacterium]
MKNTFFLAVAALLFSVAVNAQSTVDSIAAKYKLLPMPAPLTIEKTFPVLGTYTLAGTGQEAAATTVSADAVATDAAIAVAAPSLTVTLDSVNKGMIWIEGLPEGKIKAYLQKSPATYRVLAQKSESGKSVPEGTLILDTTTQTLNIALGAPFNATTPEAIFAFNNSTPDNNEVEIKAKSKTAKTKAKVTFYTANKVVVEQAVDTQVQDEDQRQDDQTTEQKEGEVKEEVKEVKEGENG